jgi:hypothetical protein
LAVGSIKRAERSYQQYFQLSICIIALSEVRIPLGALSRLLSRGVVILDGTLGVLTAVTENDYKGDAFAETLSVSILERTAVVLEVVPRTNCFIMIHQLIYITHFVQAL